MRISTELTDDAVLGEIGRRLRQERLGRNVSQADLARQAGIGQATLQRLEDGSSGTLTTLIRVLRALDLEEGLERLIPEAGPSPLDEVHHRGRGRRRARRVPGDPGSDPGAPWRWGDEEDGGS